MNYTHHIKAREKGKKAWRFITPELTLNPLRIHAARFTLEEAVQAVMEWSKQDERYEFKTVKIER